MPKPTTNQHKNIHSIPDDIRSKTCCLRVSFIASMVVAAVICGSVTFQQVQHLELALAEQAYYSVAASAIKGAYAITQRKIQSTEIMASTISYQFPDASSYPFVALPGYSEISSKVTDVSDSLIGYTVILTPDQVSAFERFAAATYLEQGYPQGAGMSDFGFGVWRNDFISSLYNDRRAHDSSPGVEYGGKYSLLAPIFLTSNLSTTNLMYNSYSGNITQSSTDAVIDCSNAANATGTKPNCLTLTNFFELPVKPGPSSVILQPVYPANDPTTVVGFSTAPITWGDVLNDVVPDSVTGLYCVISSESTSFTYAISNGKPTFLGKGDLHDTSYDRYEKSAVISASDSISNASSTFTLSVYPSEKSFDIRSPWLLTIGFVIVIAICTAIFFLYDYLMRNEARQRKVIIEMKRRFVRFVSHEIRTPLNTVCLGLELLRADLNPTLIDENDDEPEGTAPLRLASENEKLLNWSNLVDDILENSNNAVGILNDLLNYDKMEHGTLNLEITSVSIWDLISKTVSSFEIESKKRAIQLTCTIERAPSVDLTQMYVVGDDVRLRQVVRNVISNSLKFAPQGTGEVNVVMMYNPDGLPNAVTPRDDIVNAATSTTLMCTYPRAGTIKILIKDNGIGLSEAQLERLFQEGVQFEPNKQQDGGGSGLGLYITKGLVEKHGGTINLISEGQNKGCTAIIELPLYKNPARTRSSSVDSTRGNNSPLHAPRKKYENSKSTGSHRCLVVDDSLPNRKMLVRLLERSGHVCLSACHGQEAIEIMETDMLIAYDDENHVPIDTIFMDYEMPILNGPNATKAIRDSGCTATIIGVTGNLLAEDVNYFVSMGADKVLPKPVSMVSIQESWTNLDLVRAV